MRFPLSELKFVQLFHDLITSDFKVVQLFHGFITSPLTNLTDYFSVYSEIQEGVV